MLEVGHPKRSSYIVCDELNDTVGASAAESGIDLDGAGNNKLWERRALHFTRRRTTD